MGIREINPDVKVIISSGFAQDDRVKEVMKQGAQTFIQKPYTVSNMAKNLRKVLDEN